MKKFERQISNCKIRESEGGDRMALLCHEVLSGNACYTFNTGKLKVGLRWPSGLRRQILRSWMRKRSRVRISVSAISFRGSQEKRKWIRKNEACREDQIHYISVARRTRVGSSSKAVSRTSSKAANQERRASNNRLLKGAIYKIL